MSFSLMRSTHQSKGVKVPSLRLTINATPPHKTPNADAMAAMMMTGFLISFFISLFLFWVALEHRFEVGVQGVLYAIHELLIIEELEYSVDVFLRQFNIFVEILLRKPKVFPVTEPPIEAKTLEEASKITNKDIADYLGGLPPQKMHCSVMGREAMAAAIQNFKTGENTDKNLESELLCDCYGVSENEIRRVVTENSLKTVEEVVNFTKAGGGCGRCRGKIEEILKSIGEGR
jgi:bacterioferritin-associated ferredoxin